MLPVWGYSTICIPLFHLPEIELSCFLVAPKIEDIESLWSKQTQDITWLLDIGFVQQVIALEIR